MCFSKHQLSLNISSFCPAPYLSDARASLTITWSCLQAVNSHICLMILLSATSPPLPSSSTSVLNLSTCPTPGESPPWPRTSHWQQMEFSGVADGSIADVAVKNTCRCRGIHFCSLISTCRAVISWAPIRPRAQSRLQGAAERENSSSWGRPVLDRQAQPRPPLKQLQYVGQRPANGRTF